MSGSGGFHPLGRVAKGSPPACPVATVISEAADTPVMNDLLGEFDHPAWFTAIGTAIGYGVILVILAVLLFAVPLLIFSAL